LAAEKLESSTTTLTFLGIRLDTKYKEIRIPADKVTTINQLLTARLPKQKATKRQILSLFGTLHHATKVVHPGKAFVSRMHTIVARLRRMHFITELNKSP